MLAKSKEREYSYRMNFIKNISDFDDFAVVAHDISALLRMPENHDIAIDFPGSVARYSRDVDEVVAEFQKTQQACRPGVRQQFIAMAGDRAVGMSVIQLAGEVPEGIDASWPNVSGFVCNPYRNQGIGRLSLLARLQVADEQFGGRAWTKVRNDNAFSRRMVTHAGFVPVHDTDGHTVYSYSSMR
jgi:hypothetical protein